MKNKDLVTCIYYTSNREKESFEKRIQENILKHCGDLPIISVSQKPIDFGHNICVGDIGQSYLNEWKQLLIGLKEAKTEFCIAAESDCLYPPEYFTFIPPEKNIVYRYSPVWAYWKNRNKFWKKPRMEGAQMCCRKYWIERLENALSQSEDPKKVIYKIFDKEDRWEGSPVITFLTGDGIGTKTSLDRSISPVTKLEYWGKAETIHKKYFNNI